MKIKYAKKDFTLNNLPHNRKEQFRFLFKTRKRDLFHMGLVLLLFLIPELALLITSSLGKIGAGQALKDNSLTIEEYNSFFIFLTLAASTLKLITYSFFALAVSGIGNLMKKLCFEEPFFFWYDFKNGIKRNYRNVFGITLFVWIYVFIADMVKQFAELSSSSLLYLAYGLIIGMGYLYLFSFFLMTLSQCLIYENKLKWNFQNSFHLILRDYWQCLIFSLLPLSFCVLSFFSLSFWYYIFYLFLVILLPLYYLGFFLNNLSLFDTFLHQDIQELYKKGLH